VPAGAPVGSGRSRNLQDSFPPLAAVASGPSPVPGTIARTPAPSPSARTTHLAPCTNARIPYRDLPSALTRAVPLRDLCSALRARPAPSPAPHTIALRLAPLTLRPSLTPAVRTATCPPRPRPHTSPAPHIIALRLAPSPCTHHSRPQSAPRPALRTTSAPHTVDRTDRHHRPAARTTHFAPLTNARSPPRDLHPVGNFGQRVVSGEIADPTRPPHSVRAPLHRPRLTPSPCGSHHSPCAPHSRPQSASRPALRTTSAPHTMAPYHRPAARTTHVARTNARSPHRDLRSALCPRPHTIARRHHRPVARTTHLAPRTNGRSPHRDLLSALRPRPTPWPRTIALWLVPLTWRPALTAAVRTATSRPHYVRAPHHREPALSPYGSHPHLASSLTAAVRTATCARHDVCSPPWTPAPTSAPPHQRPRAAPPPVSRTNVRGSDRDLRRALTSAE